MTKLIGVGAILGGVYYFYKYIEELIQSNKKLLLSNFDVTSEIPDDISLSNNVKSSIKIKKEKNLETPTPAEIKKATKEYLDLDKNLTSDFIVDIFTDRTDLEKFSVTKLVKKSNKYNAIFLSGNNDYFYNAQFGYKLMEKGYNLYAISFPNSGFTSNVNDPNFSTFNNIEFLFQYIDIVVEYYKLNKINIMFGHSTGGLIAIMYANYKNAKSIFIDRLILSSPFLDWSELPNPSFFEREEFLEYVITPIGLIAPKINIRLLTGKPNNTICQEFNELNFNPKYKSLFQIKTYTQWVRAITLEQEKIQNNEVNVKCKVDIFLSDKSVPLKYTDNKDNVLDIEDMKLYGANISDDVEFFIIKNSIHNCFLRINISDYI